MNKFLLFVLLFAVTTAEAQESHYHKNLRSQKENDKYGVVMMSGANMSGLTSGIYWSRVRNVDDVVVVGETPADSIARREAFVRLCQQAYDAYEVKDYYRTILYGDSALRKRYHTPDLYYFMAVSFENLGDYKDAKWAFRKAAHAGYPKAPLALKAFKQRQKERKRERATRLH